MEQVQAPQEKEYIYAPVIHLQIVRDKDMKAPRYIHRPAHVAQLLMEHYGSMDREVVVVVHLDTRMQIMSAEPIATGSLNSANVNMRDLFKGAILSNAASIILAHNHPSGAVSPSPEDVAMTRKVKQAGDLLGIELLDHLVVGYRDFASLKELGLMDDGLVKKESDMKKARQLGMFTQEDLPLFSGTAQRARPEVFKPQPRARQLRAFDCPLCCNTGYLKDRGKYVACTCDAGDQYRKDAQGEIVPPWMMTRREYQESKAMLYGGGVPILNAADGREHERMVREALERGEPVPGRVLVMYPDMAPKAVFEKGEKTWISGNQITIITDPYKQHGKMWQDGVTSEGKVLTALTPEQRERDAQQQRREWREQQAGFARLKMAQKGDGHGPRTDRTSADAL